MTLDKDGNYIPWVQPLYGFDANDAVVNPPKGYKILNQGEILKQGDIPFDVYSGWFKGYDGISHHYQARSAGRFTTYARPIL